MNYIPYVLDNRESYDIFSCLLKNRIIMLTGEINDQSASIVVASLLFLDSLSHEKISLYINSPGGSVISGLEIIDTMNYITSKVETIAIGAAMSMGAMILACGEKGMRYALPNSEIMIHQPSGGFEGKELDVRIYANRLLSLKYRLYEILAEKTNKDMKTIEEKSQNDCFFTAIEAKNFGLIDEVIEKKSKSCDLDSK